MVDNYTVHWGDLIDNDHEKPSLSSIDCADRYTKLGIDYKWEQCNRSIAGKG